MAAGNVILHTMKQTVWFMEIKVSVVKESNYTWKRTLAMQSALLFCIIKDYRHIPQNC